MARRIKHVVLFGEKSSVQYFTSRALDFQGYPAQKRADNLNVWTLLIKREWKYIGHVARNWLWFRPLQRIALYFPYPEPPHQFMDGLKFVHAEVKEIEVD